MSFLMILIAGIVGGTNTPLVKLNISYFTPPKLAFLRFFLATLIILPLFLTRRGQYKLPNKQLLFVNILFAANILIFVYAIQFTSIIVAQSFYLLNTVVVAALGYFYLKEKLSRKQILGLITAMLGLLLIVEGSIRTQDINSFGTPFGNLLLMTGVIIWSLYVICSRKISSKFSVENITLYNFLITSLLALMFILIDPKKDIIFTPINNSIIISLLSLAFFSTVAFFFIYQWIIKHTSAFIVTLVNYLSSVFAISSGILFFNENLTTNLILGAFLIILGTYIATSIKLKLKVTMV